MCVWKVSMKCLIYVGKEIRKFVGLYVGSSLQEIFRKCLENPKSFRKMPGKCLKNVWKVSKESLESFQDVSGMSRQCLGNAQEVSCKCPVRKVSRKYIYLDHICCLSYKC